MVDPNNIYNKCLVAAPSDQASHNYRMFANIILSLCQIYCTCIIYMISVNLENNDDRKMSSRKRLETTLYLRTLRYPTLQINSCRSSFSFICNFRLDRIFIISRSNSKKLRARLLVAEKNLADLEYQVPVLLTFSLYRYRTRYRYQSRSEYQSYQLFVETFILLSFYSTV
jgi:hypothetical protein